MTNGTTGGSGRNLRSALMASLAFNVLIVGAVAAALLLPFLHGGKRHGPPPPTGLAGFAETLPADRAAFVRGKVDGQKAAFGAMRSSTTASGPDWRKIRPPVSLPSR